MIALLLLLIACPIVPPYQYAEHDSGADTGDTGDTAAPSADIGDTAAPDEPAAP